MLKRINETVDFLQAKFPRKPQFGIILGTGLGALVNDIAIETTIDYADIPNFEVSTVESHSGKLIFGRLSGKDVVVMQGRFHYYEGYTMQQVTFPVRVLKFLGIERLFISNAAGGLLKAMHPSDIMIINDHINLQPENPLRGVHCPEFGPRFPDLMHCYDRQMIDQALDIAQKNDIKCFEGVYVSLQGPCLETPAEYRYLAQIGADAVGMSTVPEVLVAVQMGLPVFAVSVITDEAFPDVVVPVTIESVLKAAFAAEPKMTFLIKELLKTY